MKVTDKNTKLKLQGDIVLVIADKDEFLFTIVRFQDGDTDELQLVNRDSKEREIMPVTQAVIDNLVPIKHERAKWKLVL